MTLVFKNDFWLWASLRSRRKRNLSVHFSNTLSSLQKLGRIPSIDRRMLASIHLESVAWQHGLESGHIPTLDKSHRVKMTWKPTFVELLTEYAPSCWNEYLKGGLLD
jgi:hypothetical protein